MSNNYQAGVIGVGQYLKAVLQSELPEEASIRDIQRALKALYERLNKTEDNRKYFVSLLHDSLSFTDWDHLTRSMLEGFLEITSELSEVSAASGVDNTLMIYRRRLSVLGFDVVPHGDGVF